MKYFLAAFTVLISLRIMPQEVPKKFAKPVADYVVYQTRACHSKIWLVKSTDFENLEESKKSKSNLTFNFKGREITVWSHCIEIVEKVKL